MNKNGACGSAEALRAIAIPGAEAPGYLQTSLRDL
jgi:hypothetical protein